MLIQRLIIDTLRRLSMIYGTAVVGILALALIARAAQANGVDLPLGKRTYSMTMALTWFLALIPLAVLEAREIVRLPMSRREFWIVRWCLSTIVPATLIAVALAIGNALAPGLDLGPGRVALAAFYSFVYGGCFLVVSVVAAPRVARSNSLREIARGLFVIFGVLLGGVALPFVFQEHLPQSIDALNGPLRNVFIAALGITLANYFYYPSITPRAGRPQWNSAASKRPVKARSFGRLTGLPSLFWKEGRKALLINASTLVLAIVYWRIFESGSKTIGDVIAFPTFADFLHAGGALVFADVSSRSPEIFPVIAMLLFFGISDVGLMGELRRFRTLPLSSTRLAAALSGLGFVTTSALWIALLAAHMIALGTAPISLRPDLFLLLSGCVAVSIAIRLALPGSPGVKLMGTAILIIPALRAFPMLTSHTNASLRAAWIAAGAFALAASFLINRRSIRNSTRLYKKQVMALPFGAGAPQERM